MFCTKCGSMVEDGTKFCPTCGQPMETVESFNQSEQVNNNATYEQVNNEPVNSEPVNFEPVNNDSNQNFAGADGQPNLTADGKPKKKVNFVLIGVIVALIAAIGAGGFFTWKYFDDQKKKTFDIAEYINVEFEGYDGYGTAVVKVEDEKLLKRVGEALDASKSKAKKAFKKAGKEEFDPSESFYDVIKWEVDKKENLKNGDEVTLKIKVDEDAIEEIGIKIKDAEKTVKVEGLKELVEFDPFADVEVTFDGMSPSIDAEYKNNGTGKFFDDFYVYYAFDKSYGLKSGEKAVLTVSVTEEEAMEKGYKLTQTSKEYEVPKTDAYVESVDAVSESTVSELSAKAKEVIEEYFDDNKDYLTQSDLKYEGMYLIYSKSGSNSGYIVYSANVKSKKKEFKPTKVYFPVGFEKILEKVDGTQEFSDVDDYISGSYETGLALGWSEVKGYVDLKAMKEDLTSWYTNTEYYTITITPVLDPDASGTTSTTENETTEEETTQAGAEDTTSEDTTQEETTSATEETSED